MDLLEEYDKSEAISPACLANILSGDERPSGLKSFWIVNEIKPSDLYSYLYSKFGAPNGLQNFLRNDSSDNLIHWECKKRDGGI